MHADDDSTVLWWWFDETTEIEEIGGGQHHDRPAHGRGDAEGKTVAETPGALDNFINNSLDRA